MALEFYYVSMSPPSRMVWMTLKALNLKFNANVVNLMEGAQKKPEYLAINARGKVPAVKDGDYVIAESRAIATYLCNQYEKGDDSNRLYPVEPKARGIVDQILYVSENTNDQIQAYVNTGGVLFGGKKPCYEKLEEVHKALVLYEGYLEKNVYMAGGNLTLADFFMMSPLLMLDLPGFDGFGKYPKTVAWLGKLKALPYFDECNKEGLELLTGMYQKKLTT